MNDNICYVSAFLDLEREKWTHFTRTFEEYFISFLPLVDLVSMDSNCQLVLFIDEKRVEKVKSCITSTNIFVIDINKQWMKSNSVLWNRLDRESEIMNLDRFKKLISHRIHCPETTNPNYTLINHAKIDFVNYAINLFDNFNYFCWVDFGYFSKRENIPQALINIDKLDKNRINYTLINPIDDNDKNIIYTLRMAPEKIGGFFFLGDKKSLREYQKLYHYIHKSLQDINIVDDDQHLALQCYFSNPDLFCMHHLGAWHKAFLKFSKIK